MATSWGTDLYILVKLDTLRDYWRITDGRAVDSRMGGPVGQRYNNTPIIEAVIEFRVTPSEGLTLEDVARVHAGEESRYPSIQKQMNLESQVQMVENELSAVASQRDLGYVYASADGRRRFHSTVDGFIFGQLAPYDNWEGFAGEAWRLWQLYRERTKPEQVVRVGVRYINRIEIAKEQIEIKDYLRTFPELSPDLPQILSGYFVQIQVPLPDYEAGATITSALDKQSPETISIILDIDCHNSGTLDTSAEEFDNRARDVVNTLRQAKNAVFEACITDETRRLIS